MTKQATIIIIVLIVILAAAFVFFEYGSGTSSVLAQCAKSANGQATIIQNGGTLTVKNTDRKFLSFPRDVYPEANLFVKNITGNAFMGFVSNGDMANDPNSPCWTHYYEFGLNNHSTQGSFDITIKSASSSVPDYSAHIVVTGM